MKYLQQLVAHQHASVSACCPVGVDAHHEHTHAGTISVPCQAETQARLAFLQLDHVQDSREVGVALDNVLWENEVTAGGSGQVAAEDFFQSAVRTCPVLFSALISQIQSGHRC